MWAHTLVFLYVVLGIWTQVPMLVQLTLYHWASPQPWFSICKMKFPSDTELRLGGVWEKALMGLVCKWSFHNKEQLNHKLFPAEFRRCFPPRKTHFHGWLTQPHWNISSLGHSRCQNGQRWDTWLTSPLWISIVNNCSRFILLWTKEHISWE